MFSVSFDTSGIESRLRQFEDDAEQRAAQIVNDAADYAEREFLQRVSEQIALNPARVRSLVRLEKRQTSATLTAADDAIRLEEYPHRQARGGVEVQINPGQVSFIEDAFVSRRGHVVRRQADGSIPRQQFGPGVNQIANTEFPELAIELKQRMAADFRR